jgi:hypothetical protein
VTGRSAPADAEEIPAPSREFDGRDTPRAYVKLPPGIVAD